MKDEKRIEVIHLEHGAEVVLRCGCQRTVTIKRPAESNSIKYICDECNIERVYSWSRLAGGRE